MSILINEETRALVYGLSGKYGTAQTTNMLSYGTKIVAGVSAGKGGKVHLGLPMVDTAKEAVEKYQANAAIIYIPAIAIKNAAFEAIDAGLKFLFIPTEGIPVHDMMQIRQVALDKGVWIVGPNSLGIISPGQCLIGSIAPEFTKKGNIGVISRSGTLSLEVVSFMTNGGYGQSTVVSIGGDAVLGRNPIDYFKEFEEDEDTEAIVILGEIGGMKEYEIVDYIPSMSKPVLAYIGGKSAKQGKRMGHMGALIGTKKQDAISKLEALKNAGAMIVDTPWDICERLKDLNITRSY